jgi:hypothetical protein
VLIPSSVLGWMFAAVHARRVSDPIRLVNELEAQRDMMVRRAAEIENDTLAVAADHVDRLIKVLRLDGEVVS